MPHGSRVCFGTFELDLETGELRKHGRTVKLARQPFRTLALLARSPGKLVTRESIRREIWGNDRFVDFENGLNFCIRRIRAVLGDDARKPRFIETLPGRGYRFIFGLSVPEGVSSSPVAGQGPGEAVTIRVVGRGLAGRCAIVITEFLNLAGDPEIDWLATGLAENLTVSVGRLPLVWVVSAKRVGAAVRKLRAEGNEKAILDTTALGRELGADWVVSGSYQRAGGRLQIAAQFTNVGLDERVSAGPLVGTWEQLFELQDQLASDLSAAIGLHPVAAARLWGPVAQGRDLQAFEHYSQARRLLRQMDKQSLGEALTNFQLAAGLAPTYAMAHAGLGATYAMRYIHRSAPDDLLQAMAQLEEATRLDPDLAEPYPWLCYVYMRSGRLSEALRAGHKSVLVLPDLVQAHYFLGLAYFAACEREPSNYPHAVTHLFQATRVEPEWQASWYVLGNIAMLHGEYDSAEKFAARLQQPSAGATGAIRFLGSEILHATLHLRRGDHMRALEWLAESAEKLHQSDHVYREAMLALTACLGGDVRLRQGESDLALTAYRQAWHLVQEFPTMGAHARHSARTLAGLAAAHAARDDKARSDEVMERATILAEEAAGPQAAAAGANLAELHYSLAAAHARRKEMELALAHLESALSAGWRDARWLERDSEFDALRGETRFSKLSAILRELPELSLTDDGRG